MRKEQKFLLGAATAAHQVEGNNIYSDYWAQEQMQFTGFAEPSANAVDHYNRFEEDIQYLAEAGLNAYRFSIEWARIQPRQGYFDKEETEHYRKVLHCCKKYGIEPVVTMHHFSSPKWVIEKGGWESEQIVSFFADYCRYVIEELGSDIQYVCTINEANMGLQLASIMEKYRKIMEREAQAKGNGSELEGQVQIGMTISPMEYMKKAAEENIRVFGTAQPQTFVSSRTKEGDLLIMKAHQAAKEAMKKVKPSLQVGLSFSLHDIQYEKGGEKPAEEKWFEEFLHYCPYIEKDDFIGIQNYTRTVYSADGVETVPEGGILTQSGYENYPEALEHVIRKVNETLKIPVLVTENGIATTDDREREAFIDTAIKGVKSCILDGIPVKGYFHWSLLDNFEWQKGFAMKFGLIAVDRMTMERYPKGSLKKLGSYLDELDYSISSK